VDALLVIAACRKSCIAVFLPACTPFAFVTLAVQKKLRIYYRKVL
jgi:hypothetical protein